jgi:Uma2 family endonuclease
MTTLRTTRRPRRKTWTVYDLYRRFGPILFERIRHDPPPGTATVKDVDRLNIHEDRLYELVDGILVEKTVGLRESLVAAQIIRALANFAEPRNLGVVAGEAGTIQLDVDLVRIPDVAFFSWARIPGRKIPKEPVPLLVPDLAVEVISVGNTRKELDEKLHEYFERGVRLVWYVRPRTRAVDVYTAPDRFTRLTATMTLDGGDVLPGFTLRVGDLFDLPGAPEAATGKPRSKKPKRGR